MEGIRTKKEKDNKLFNYYLCFGIETNKKSEEISAILSQRRLIWTQGTAIQRRYLELWGDITEVMVYDAVYNESTNEYERNSGGRKQELLKAKEIILKEAISALKHRLNVNHIVVKRDLFNIYRANSKYITMKELEAACCENSIEYVNNLNLSFDFNDYDEIDNLLFFVEKEDLYDFLGVDKNIDMDFINDKISVVYKGIKRKISSLGQAGVRLCEFSKRILNSVENRKMYDLFLLIKDIYINLKSLKSAGIPFISYDEYEYNVIQIVHKTNLSLLESKRILEDIIFKIFS